MSRIQELLERTSRTFALSIPLLEEPLRRQVSTAYLLFRIADTVEDESELPAEWRAGVLDSIAKASSEPGELGDALGGLVDAFAGQALDDGYAELLRDASTVLDAFTGLDAQARTTIACHFGRTCSGMAEHLRNGVAPESVESLQAYCYIVAGIVGEMLTDLYVNADGITPSDRARLDRLAPPFGEGLQLVNILRDEHDDSLCDRRYLSDLEDRTALISLAADDLCRAGMYIESLEASRARPGTLAFNGLNACLAIETLALVRDQGPGVKLDRARVGLIHDRVRVASVSDQPRVGALVLETLEACAFESTDRRACPR